MRIVGERLAAEAASEKGHVDGNIFNRNAHSLTQVGLNPVRLLYRSPYFNALVAYMGDTIKRLHTAMGFVRSLINGFDLFIGILQSCFKFF